MSVPNNSVFLVSVVVLSIFAIGVDSGEVTIVTIDQSDVSPGGGSENKEVAVPLEVVVVSSRTSKSEAAMNEIIKDASASLESGAPSTAVSAIEEGLKATIELIVASSDAAEKSLVSAKQNAYQNPQAAIRAIATGMRTAQGLIRSAEIPIYYSLDFGNGSKNEIQKGLQQFRKGVKYALACLSAAETMVSNGLRSNLAGVGKGLEAAEEAAIMGYDVVYESLILTGRLAFRELSNEATGPQKENTPLCTARTVHPSAEAKAAESEITLKAKEAILSVNQSSIVANVISKIENILTCGIRTVSEGEASVAKAVLIATELASDEPEIASASFKAGLKALKMGVLTAGNITCQGLGEVEYSLGNQKSNKFVLAILKVRNGTSSALVGLKSAEKLASIGFKMGGAIAEQGLRAFYKSTLAVLFEFYSLLVAIGEEAF